MYSTDLPKALKQCYGFLTLKNTTCKPTAETWVHSEGHVWKKLTCLCERLVFVLGGIVSHFSRLGFETKGNTLFEQKNQLFLFAKSWERDEPEQIGLEGFLARGISAFAWALCPSPCGCVPVPDPAHSAPASTRQQRSGTARRSMQQKIQRGLTAIQPCLPMLWASA